MVHGHVHLRYGLDQTRERTYGSTRVINACERYVLEIPDRKVPLKHMYQLRWAKKVRDRSDDTYMAELLRIERR